MMADRFDILVIGGGHAGIEAVHSAWRMGLRAGLVSMSLRAIGRMSCNPAIGGVGKGQIVRDIDALGGLMGKLADETGIQFRVLNESKGPAVWGPRCQSDMEEYSKASQRILGACTGLVLIEGEVAELKSAGPLWTLTLGDGRSFETQSVVITSGTFLGARMYTGLEESVGGRIGEPAAQQLSDCLQTLGIRLRRLKTGTPSRLDPKSLDYSACEVQHGDDIPFPFSWSTKRQLHNRSVCWITRTTLQTHEILRTGFAQSPMFTGMIHGRGPRYCPSIEDKINRFADKESHQLFLEPEGFEQGRIYVNGFSSSLPAEVQLEALRSIPGLENCQVLQIGYAVEYDAVDATQLHPTLECRAWPGLYFAGQVCGTSGYEEAAGQGLIAGINAALKVQNRPAFILGRSESYIGVMLDDLVAIPLEEPYRMFTSRAEYRLFLRYDNAAQRLTGKGRELGMVEDSQWEDFLASEIRLESGLKILSETGPDLETANEILAATEQAPLVERPRWIQLLRRPGVDGEVVFAKAGLLDSLDRVERLHLRAEELYRGFYERQARDIDQQKRLESLRLDADFDYARITALSFESRQKLLATKPMSIGQAARIPGVRPADVSVLIHWLNNQG
jgi:tRNA uridine 5-carboxymethylaminomethyl modification enzyme